MAANFSEFMSKKILDSLFANGVALPVYGSVWAALFHDSTGTTEANLRDNTPINEITDASYARVELVITGEATFDAAIAGTTGQQVISNTVINWVGAAADYPNDVAFIALFTASTLGDVIVYSDITPTPITLGQYIKVPIAAFTINL